jgi:hypothetical protein
VICGPSWSPPATISLDGAGTRKHACWPFCSRLFGFWQLGYQAISGLTKSWPNKDHICRKIWKRYLSDIIAVQGNAFLIRISPLKPRLALQAMAKSIPSGAVLFETLQSHTERKDRETPLDGEVF